MLLQCLNTGSAARCATIIPICDWRREHELRYANLDARRIAERLSLLLYRAIPIATLAGIGSEETQ